VTGTASGAVGSYLRYQGALDEEDPLVFEQGHFRDRPGRVLVDTREGEEGETAPRVGGQAVTALDGDLTIPDSDEDDIIEA
jgi:predicted PhzF superfamily epimerase YddE/YHI9